MTRSGIKLPERVTACLFDMDGVLTQTAKVHNAAWEQTFNAFLRRRADALRQPYQPFDPVGDYQRYVDGRARADGVRAFLASRQITVPEGSADDAPDLDTVFGIGNRKNQLLLERIRTDGVDVFQGSVTFLHAARAAGLRTAVVSASANTPDVLAAVGLEELFDVRVDGNVALDRGLRGKPQPDTFAYAAELLGVTPAQAAVFEDALAGVAAGRAGGFGLVVGVDRTDGDRTDGRSHADALRENGADLVVNDLTELLA
ncbi:beta-phosphoglucomutase family hydrolase [Allocatelliglobosispora scoriae]|uniref:Beta-phosphoglucomutase n=1 Tax=Allocatelliglobosispora scoriae TaxID=643052 RepID=A0A841BPW3_9ACTN|nr:beta-phosphoglucomutase family hydrolase [Allocatelliglobosispora scoriae]MBB5868860.1 beta-phosphoglucomutase family hydrolase [Allocatelliglobosispora scoriae]